jgi:transposase-like protein
LVIRYCHKTNTTIVDAMQKLFNINTRSPNYFPYNLEYLVMKLPYDKSEFIERFIWNNTFFPVYSLFLPSDLSGEMLNDFEKVISNKDLAILSLRHNITKEFNFCSKCIKADTEQGREPYAHRMHQFNNLSVCLFHKTELINKCLLCDELLYEENNKNPRISVGKCKHGHDVNSKEYNLTDLINMKLKVLQGLHFLFENYSRLKGFPLYDYYKVYLIKKDYMNYLGRLNNKSFYKDFLEFFSEDLLTQLGYDVKQLNNRLALRIFTKDKYSYDPYLHILAIIFLADSVEEFFNNPLPILDCKIPFGLGPWPCINKTCKFYQEKIIKKYEIKWIKRDNLCSKFLCAHCGFHYQINFEEKISITDNKLRILDYGSVWKDKLLELYKKGARQSEIARELNVDRSTVKKYINNIKLENSDSSNRNIIDKKINKNPSFTKGKLNIEEYQELKAEIVKLSKDNSLIRSMISEIVGPKKYGLVMRTEPKWMDEILPKKVPYFREKDWPSIDLNLAEVLESKAKELYQTNPSRRITKYLILSTLNPSDKRRIVHHPNKLQKSMITLDKYTEGKEAYQLRIIPHTIKYMKETGYSLKLESIFRFRRFRDCSEKVKQEIFNFIHNSSLLKDNVDT